MKGQSWGIVEIFGLLAVIIGFLVITGFFSKSASGPQTVLTDFCSRNPTSLICGGDSDAMAGNLASYSTDVLACGIDSIATGSMEKNSRCLQSYSPEKKTISAGIGLVRAESDFQPPSIQCDGQGFLTVEYEEDEITLEFGDFNVENVFYRFNPTSREWEWKINENWYPVSGDLSRIDKLKDVYPELTRDLRDKDEVGGLKVFVKYVSKTDDDYLKIHYPDGVESTTDKELDADNFVEEVLRKKGNNIVLEKCKIKSFNLPQDFYKFDIPILGETDFNWVGVVGDPKYVTYFQTFPPGEDTDWSGQSSWYKTFGTLMFAGMCVGHAVLPFAQGWQGLKAEGKQLVSHPISTLKEAGSGAADRLVWLKDRMAAAGSAIRKAGQPFEGFNIPEKLDVIAGSVRTGLTKLIGRFSLNRAIVDKYKNVDDFYAAMSRSSSTLRQNEIIAIREAFTKIPKGEYTGAELWSYLPKTQVVSILGQMSGISNIVSIAEQAILNKHFLTYTGIDSVASYFLNRTDSEWGKFVDEYPSALSLQQSMFLSGLRKTFNLTGLKSKEGSIAEKVGIPVILDKSTWLGGTTSLYFASPCRADLTVTKQKVTCNSYSYDTESDYVTCDTQSSVPFWDSGIAGNLRCGDQLWLGDYKFDDVSGKLTTKIDLKNREKEIVNNLGGQVISSGEATLTIDGNKKARKKIEDPINNFVYYYNQQENRIDYISKDGGKNFILVPSTGDPNYNGGIYSNTCTSVTPTTSTIDEYHEDIRAVVGGGLDDPHVECKVNYVRNKKVGLVFIDVYALHTTIHGQANEKGILENPFAVSLEYDGVGYVNRPTSQEDHFKTLIVLKDDNGDGNLDEVGHYIYAWTPLPGSLNEVNPPRVVNELFYTVYVDTDLNGAADKIIANKCSTDGIIVTPDQSPYQKSVDSYNYCYQKNYDSMVGAVTMTASFGASALAKVAKIGGVKGRILAATVDCGLAYVHMKYGKTAWPGKEY